MPGEPMEAAQRSAEYVFQGIMYYFRREKVCPRYQFTLKDPVDPALLQQALDAALEAAPYYRVRLVWEKRKAFLEPTLLMAAAIATFWNRTRNPALSTRTA